MMFKFGSRYFLFAILCLLFGGIISYPYEITISVFGYDESNVTKPPDEHVVFDSFFNDTSEKTKRDHLNYFALTLNERPDQIGYVISYSGIYDINCESLKNLKMIRKYLVETKKIKSERLVFIDGGYVKRGMTDFYVESKSVRQPAPSPTFQLEDVLSLNP